MNIIEMAGEVDAVTKVLLDRKEPQGMSHDVFLWFLERFAELVAAQEREECAELCDGLADTHEKLSQWSSHKTADTLAQAIRARGTT